VLIANAIATELGLGLEAPDSFHVGAVRQQLGLPDALMPELMAYATTVVAQIN
jgi:hypothetical protein